MTGRLPSAGKSTQLASRDLHPGLRAVERSVGLDAQRGAADVHLIESARAEIAAPGDASLQDVLPVAGGTRRMEREALGPQRHEHRGARRRRASRSARQIRCPPASSTITRPFRGAPRTCPCRKLLLPMKSATKGSVGMVVDLLRRAELAHAAAVHHGDAVAQRQRLRLVVRHVHGGEAHLPRDLGEPDARALAQPGIQVRQRLVQQQHLAAGTPACARAPRAAAARRRARCG